MAEQKQCPFCMEMIIAEAVKCRYCGEFLDETLRQQRAAETIAVKSQGPSTGIAILLSLIIPGAGQMYRDQVGRGLAYFLIVTLCYMATLMNMSGDDGIGLLAGVVGVIVHVACLADAGGAFAPQPEGAQ